MNQQIKQRIEQINNGQVPEGYKETEFGIFPCDWVTDKTFGDLFSFNGGLGKSREELSENGIEYLHYGDMHRSDFNIASLEQYSKLPKYDTKIKGDESFLMQDGDVAFLDASEDLEGTSRSVLIDNPENKPFIAGLHIIYGRPRGKELSKYYKQYLTRPEYIKKQFKKLASGFKVYGLNRNTITGIKCAYPKFTAEQEKIAEILMKWDEAIVLYDRQIEKLKRLKLVCIKKMFPKKRSKVPEVRFKGFTKDWEQRKLGDIVGIYDGVHQTPNYQNSGVMFLSVENIATLKSSKFISEEDFKRDYKVFPQENDILMTRIGDVGTTNVVTDNGLKAYYVSLALLKYKSTDPYFLSNAIRSDYVQKGLANRTLKTAIPMKINKDEIGKVSVMLPLSATEQQQIGTCFRNLDNLITLHQRKVEKIKTQRKALQQYLLNGIVRVEV